MEAHFLRALVGLAVCRIGLGQEPLMTKPQRCGALFFVGGRFSCDR
jgi:hypothetical protein